MIKKCGFKSQKDYSASVQNTCSDKCLWNFTTHSPTTQTDKQDETSFLAGRRRGHGRNVGYNFEADTCKRNHTAPRTGPGQEGEDSSGPRGREGDERERIDHHTDVRHEPVQVLAVVGLVVQTKFF